MTESEKINELNKHFERLNEQQREAVEYLDGPLLVIAGPGTGKTQLLSLRAANILLKRDVQPKNVLCLTFSNAGAEAMRKRLVELIGRDAYGIEVATFHSFAESVKSRWPEYFSRPASAALVSEMRKKKIINKLLNSLPVSSALFSNPKEGGISAFLEDVVAFVGNFKRSGLTSDEYRAILNQNIEFFEFAESDEELMALVNADIPRKKAEKPEFCEQFESNIVRVCDAFLARCDKAPVSAMGVYEPYAKWLKGFVCDAELIDEDGKTAGLSNVRGSVFAGKAGERTFADRKTVRRALAACDIYDSYVEEMDGLGLYDYDDMILDCIRAVESSPELQNILQERYEYIQVDEFQDTNGAQMRILELLAGNNAAPNLMAVCDDDQAIMRFQGASIECINQFQAKWHPKNIVLKVNYRSTPAIVELGKSVAELVETRLPASSTDKDISAFNPQVGSVEFVEKVFASEDAERYALAEDISKHIEAGFVDSCSDPDEAIAVIANKHAKLKGLLPYLNEFDVPFSYKETSDVFQMESMQTLLAAMRFVAYASIGKTVFSDAQLPFIVAARELELSSEECLTVAKKMRMDRGRDWTFGITEVAHGRLADFCELLLGLAADAAAMPVRELIFRISQPLQNYYKREQENDPWSLAEFNAGIRALLNFVEDEMRGGVHPARALRITDVVECMDDLERFGISINASISLGKEGAVRLVSAHGSKGLEFDRVYMLDAEDRVWHKNSSSTNFFPANMLIGNQKDDDDARRLLFVALTRAKRELELFRAGGQTLRELEGEIETYEAQPSADEAVAIIETSWTSRYSCDSETYRSLLVPDMVPSYLSVSALNNFVEYKEGATNSSDFPLVRMLKLPGAPNPNAEFGNIVHAFMEDYVNKVMKRGEGLQELAEAYRNEVLRMDFRPEEVETYASRFDRVVDEFVPSFSERMHGDLFTEVKLTALTDDGVPLFGISDLLMVDSDSREIRVFDYKTGFNYPGKTPTSDYERQLQFYKLLIEGSSEYEGYKVVESVDLYVEPEKATANTLHDPVVSSPKAEDLEHLQKLISAVWKRIQAGDFDTTAFEDSEEKAAAIAANVNKDGTPSKRPNHRLMQRAYEMWLIDNTL